MRRTRHFLFATMIAAAPIPAAAQVSVDLNALSGVGQPSLPAPPSPGAPPHTHRYYRHHHWHHLASRTGHGAGHEAAGAKPHAVATAKPAPAPAGPETVEHPSNLGPDFTSLPALPTTAPPLPAPTPTPAKTAAASPKPATSKPTPPPKPAAGPALPALPTAAPPPAAAAPKLAEATPPPPAATAKPPPPASAPDALPKGADRLTLPFFAQESDVPPAEAAMLRDFGQRHGAAAQYIVRAFASAPAGDDDPSTPRRISLSRAQSVSAALLDAGVPGDRVRLLALGTTGGAPADRVEVIAMPPASGHTVAQPSPASSP